MFLLIEIVIIAVLISALAALFIEEIGMKKTGTPRGVVREYWDGGERRKSIRVTTELPVSYIIEKKLRIKLNGESKDVSRKGMRLLINEKLVEGTLLFLEFDMPETRETISADGRVVWANGNFDERDGAGKRMFQTGIQFVSIKPADDAVLTAYINKAANK